RPSGVAPLTNSSPSVAAPLWIFSTRVLFCVVGFGTRQTLASYLSMQPDPDTTESRGHLVSGPLGGPPARVTVTVPGESATGMATMENQVFIRRPLLRDVLPGTMPDEGRCAQCLDRYRHSP